MWSRRAEVVSRLLRLELGAADEYLTAIDQGVDPTTARRLLRAAKELAELRERLETGAQFEALAGLQRQP